MMIPPDGAGSPRPKSSQASLPCLLIIWPFCARLQDFLVNLSCGTGGRAATKQSGEARLRPCALGNPLQDVASAMQNCVFGYAILGKLLAALTWIEES